MTRFTSSNAPRSPREFAQQKIQLRKQQEKLLSDLLSVVDALDHAADHWHQAAQSSTQASSPSLSWWQRWLQWLGLAKPGNPSETTTEVVVSARDGIDMIRESMLSVLSEHQVTPLPAKGHPFDPSQMHALGQQADTTVPPNTVVQEVVRGYRWQDRVLREAQVIVAAPPAEDSSPDSSPDISQTSYTKPG